MNKKNQITPNLIIAYENTNYYIGKENTLQVRINHYDININNFLIHHKIQTAAIISACNPHSKLQTKLENELHLNQLSSYLRNHDYLFIDAFGGDQLQNWPREESFCIFDITQEAAKMISALFHQNACVFIEKNRPTKLIWTVKNSNLISD